MATKSISVTVHHPYPTFEWQVKHEPDNGFGWEILSESVYGDSTTGYVDADQQGKGQGTDTIYLTDPQQGRDEAWFRCLITNPAYGAVYTDGQCYVSIGPLEWTVDLIEETKTIGATGGPTWAGDMDTSREWAQTPATLTLTNYATSTGGTLTFSDANPKFGDIAGDMWTAPAHGAAPGATSGRVLGTDDSGTSSSQEFTATVTGKTPVVAIADPGTLTEGTQTPITVTVTSTDEGAGAGAFWSFSAPGMTTVLTEATGVETYTLTPDATGWVFGDNGETITVTYRAYEDNANYEHSDSLVLAIEESSPVTHNLTLGVDASYTGYDSSIGALDNRKVLNWSGGDLIIFRKDNTQNWVRIFPAGGGIPTGGTLELDCVGFGTMVVPEGGTGSRWQVSNSSFAAWFAAGGEGAIRQFTRVEAIDPVVTTNEGETLTTDDDEPLMPE